MNPEVLARKILDPAWRVEHLYKIVDKQGQRVTFKRNPIQKLVHASRARRKMILKARQFGISTDGLITKFDATIFRPNTTCAILAHDKDAIEKLFRIPMLAYKYMPEDIKPRIDRGGGSKHEMFFPEINSRIYCDLEIRGGTVQLLHGSEVAFMKDSSKLKATLQAVPLDGIVDLETTANGMGNHYYDMWTDTEQPYEKMFFPWYMFPDYQIPVDRALELTEDELELVAKAKRLFNIDITHAQIQFRRLKKSELRVSSSDKVRVTFEQEYPEDDKTCFLASGESVMDLFVIAEMINRAGKPLEDNGWRKVYEQVHKDGVYVCGADTAEGVQGDYSVGVMIECRSKRVVATIRGHWKPYEFAHKLHELCALYQKSARPWPLLGVERNNHGHAVLLELQEHIRYPNLFYRKVGQDESLDPNPGWVTDRTTRPIMINAFIDAVENKHLIITDKSILQECLTLINNNGKIEASEGKHDDMIIAASIALQLMIERSSGLAVYDNLIGKIRM